MYHLLNFTALAISFILMEGVAWFNHKYLMHGFLWKLLSDHHHRDHLFMFERNDLFTPLFALPGVFHLISGFLSGQGDIRFWMGLGISLYGICYVPVHDIYIHRQPVYSRIDDLIKKCPVRELA